MATEKVEAVIQAMLGMQRASWEQGTAAQAILEWDRACGKDLSKDIALYALCHDGIVRQEPEGRLAIRLNRGDPGLLDPASLIEPLLSLARVLPDSKASFEEAVRKQIDFMMKPETPRMADGTLSHRVDKVQLWIDGIYMGPPALAYAGVYWDDETLVAEALKQLRSYHNYLFFPEKQLYGHIWDSATKEWERSAAWGVGNGWALAGMARVLDIIPKEGMKQQFVDILSWMTLAIDGVLKHEREDHLFHDVLDDPTTFVDANVAQQVSYTIFRLAKKGLIAETYVERAETIHRAVHGRLDAHGIIRGVCGSPFFNSSGTATEAQAFFILMEAAYLDLRKTTS